MIFSVCYLPINLKVEIEGRKVEIPVIFLYQLPLPWVGSWVGPHSGAFCFLKLSGRILAQEALPSWLAWQTMGPPYGVRKIARHPLHTTAWALNNENQAKANSFFAIC